MHDSLAIRLDGREILAIPRDGGVPGRMRSQLARIDGILAAGVEHQGRPVDPADAEQRLHYAVGELLSAVEQGAREMALCYTWFLRRERPELTAVEIAGDDDTLSVRLRFARG